MAEARGHKFGQFIGEYCEKAMEPLLQEIADKHGLFLDKKGVRPARSGVKLRWIDHYKNGQELDYVFERGGTPEKIGTPVAFVESAWRRYTKHSKNKAQEIQGAVLPIAEKHRFSAPMLGCILAGDYTSAALEQLRSLGFKVLYLNYDTVIAAFASVGVDVHFDKDTAEAEFDKRMEKWKSIGDQDRLKVWSKLLELNQRNLEEFILHLERAVKRQISAVRVIPLHGVGQDCITVGEAIKIIENYDETAAHGPLVKYEIIIRYDNGDKIEADFQDRSTTIEFLMAYESGNWTPVPGLTEDNVE